jgi:hypothetical protein
MDDAFATLLAHGWLRVPAVLSPAAVASFRAQVDGELAAANVSLARGARGAWPRGAARRVLEVEPVGTPDGGHWAALAASPALRAALDAALGAGAWTLPVNAAGADGRRAGDRHWYAPVVFPEESGGEEEEDEVVGAGDEAEAGGAAGGSACTAESRPCPFAAQAALPRGGPWVPASRRRWAGAGWHIDSGPGFPNDGARAPEGDARQGAVVLLALSAWRPGGGGTAVVPGSHRGVFCELAARARGAGGAPSHEALNSWVVARLRALAEAGRVALPRCACGAGARACAHAARARAAAAAAARGDACPLRGGAGDLVVEQLVAAPGDAFILHPLLVHCGTANARAAPRVLANGMARLRAGVPHALMRALGDAHGAQVG